MRVCLTLCLARVSVYQSRRVTIGVLVSGVISHHFYGKHEEHAGSNFRLCCLTRLYQILISALETCARFNYYCVECLYSASLFQDVFFIPYRH